VADALADRFRLFMPDLLSRGRSDPRPDRPHDLPRELQRLDAVRELLPSRPYLLLGHSHGAALAVALSHRARAADRPGPAGWVLVTPVTPWTHRPPVLEVFTLPAVRRALGPAAALLRIPITRQVLERRAYGDPSRVDAAAVRRYAAPFRNRERAVALLRILADWRPGELSAHVPVEVPPTRVIAGGRDRRISAAEARRWARALGAEFRLAPDAGHMVPEERPDLVADAVRRVARRTGALD
jgi:magnesium chelatase accessory protein